MDKNTAFRKTAFKGLGVVLVGGLVVVLLNSGLLAQLSFENLKAQQEHLKLAASQNSVKAMLLYLFLYVMVAALSIPGATVLTLAGGAIFGVLVGSLLTSVGATLGATLCFWGSRQLFRSWVQERFQSQYTKIQRGFEREGAFYLFTLRLLPIAPFFVLNLVFGLTSMAPLTFAWVSYLGMLPAIFVYSNAGTQLAEIHSSSDVLSAKVLLSFALLGLFPWLAKLALNVWQRRRVYRAYLRPTQFNYDLVVIGGGAAGLVASYLGSSLKAKVALIEKHRQGGDCLYTGCVPSKALIRSSHVAQLFRRGSEFGLQKVVPEVDFAQVFARIQSIIGQIEPHDSVARYTELGVDCVQGTAFVEDPFRVRVGERIITTRHILLATGAVPVVPPIPGLVDVPHYTSETLWSLRSMPRRLLVLGGGAIGCELAQAFGRLGVETTLIDKSDRLLSKEDPDVSEFVLRTFIKEGVQVILQSVVLRFEKLPDGGGKALLKNGQVILFDALLLALGRRAAVTGFGLEKLALPVRADGTLEVDSGLRTRLPNILACGDVTGPFQFTHAASYQAGIATLNALASPLTPFSVDYSAMPWCTYVDPEVARMGWNETDAKTHGVPYSLYRYELAQLDRALCEGENRGFVKVLTEKDKGRILGVTIVGAHAGETMAEFALAKRKGLTLNDILNTVHAYPTFAEANRFVAGLWKRSTAPAKALDLLGRLHAWRRG